MEQKVSSDLYSGSPAVDMMTEQDVREEIIAPLVARLGYRFGHDFYVERERTLRHPYSQIGHRSAKDLPIGAADYVCGVLGRRGSFTIEAKRGDHSINEPDIIQAHSYAAHYEIGALYFVLCTGNVFTIYETLGGTRRKVVLDLPASDIASRYSEIEDVLSPESLMARADRYYEPAAPLGEKLPSSIRIKNGWISVSNFEYEFDHPMAKLIESALKQNGVLDQLDNELARVTSRRQPIIDGHVSRSNEGRIIAEIEFDSESKEIAHNMKAIGIQRMTFETDSEFISSESQLPTLFETRFESELSKDTQVFSTINRRLEALGSNVDFDTYYRVFGHLENGVFLGEFGGRAYFKINAPGFGVLPLACTTDGSFELNLALGD